MTEIYYLIENTEIHQGNEIIEANSKCVLGTVNRVAVTVRLQLELGDLDRFYVRVADSKTDETTKWFFDAADWFEQYPVTWRDALKFKGTAADFIDGSSATDIPSLTEVIIYKFQAIWGTGYDDLFEWEAFEWAVKITEEALEAFNPAGEAARYILEDIQKAEALGFDAWAICTPYPEDDEGLVVGVHPPLSPEANRIFCVVNVDPLVLVDITEDCEDVDSGTYQWEAEEQVPAVADIEITGDKPVPPAAVLTDCPCGGQTSQIVGDGVTLVTCGRCGVQVQI